MELKFEKLSGSYGSPRITGEFLDCSMPMSFDQYNNCGFNCLYCFSTFQRSISHGAKDYLAKKFRSVSVDAFKKHFLDPDNSKFGDFIKKRITLQWGGLSDPFCPIEEQDGTGYEILKFLREIKYPINFSSKGDLLLRDPKYLKLFEGMGKYWSYKASIITLDAEKAKIMEAGTPSPQRRIEVLKKLGEMGIWTIWRMRPFIIGLTSLDYEKQLEEAHRIKAKALSTEFFCLELRSVKQHKAKYDLMSKVIGFDIIQYYKNISTTSGYLRLNRKIKEPYYIRMRELCDKYGINMHVSDAHGKEYADSGSCCGLPCTSCSNGKCKPSLTNYHQGQFTNALRIAKIKGEVRWSDMEPEIIGLKKLPTSEVHFNMKNYMIEGRRDLTLYDIMKNIWNTPNDSHSPYKYFKGSLVPSSLDENKNVIYKFKEFKL